MRVASCVFSARRSPSTAWCEGGRRAGRPLSYKSAPASPSRGSEIVQAAEVLAGSRPAHTDPLAAAQAELEQVAKE